MSGIFSWSPFSLLLLFFLLGGFFFAVGMVCLKHFAWQAGRDVLSIPVAAFIGTVATAWALSLGFTAADAWSINSDAARAASSERSSLSRLEGMARPEALNSEALIAALAHYRSAVGQIEWAENLNRFPTPEAEAALQELRMSILKLAKADVATPIIGQIVQDFDELQDARNTRIALGNSAVNQYKWYLVLSLTFITIVVTASIHADRPRAGRKALMMFSATAALSLWILAIHANPYAGVGQSSLDLLVVPQ
ncbi:MAG: hypothetical protein ACRECW_15785 [Phyllobacterium sp.]